MIGAQQSSGFVAFGERKSRRSPARAAQKAPRTASNVAFLRADAEKLRRERESIASDATNAVSRAQGRFIREIAGELGNSADLSIEPSSALRCQFWCQLPFLYASPACSTLRDGI